MIKVIVADDHPIVLQGLRQVLANHSNIVIHCEAKAASEVLPLVRKHSFDVVILDINMPDGSGLDVLRQLKREFPRLPVLILSMHPEEEYALRVLKAGASGYVTKQSMPEELVRAIRKVVAGGKYVSPSVAEKLAFNLEADAERPPHELLSNREYRVMCMIASGKTLTEIADALYLSVKSISTYRARLLEKMQMRTNAELIRYAIKNNLID